MEQEVPVQGTINTTNQGAIMTSSNHFKSILVKVGLITALITGPGVIGLANAGESTNACPVGLVNGLTLDDEFGPGTGDMTNCLDRRHNVKVVYQVNQFCRDSVSNADCNIKRAYALGNMRNMIKDYEITHGMVAGKDFKITAVVHSGGGWLMLKDEGTDGNGNPVSGRNQFEQQVRDLIDAGVEFYFCQNTTRSFIGKNILPDTGDSAGGATAELIEGVNYTTAGVTAIAEFQDRGYRYVQP
jgi:intracellular sulfur oxidation DsrE/DsrF family protein